MNRKFVLPVCFAAAAHGALLFGFTRHSRPPSAAVDEVYRVPFVYRQIDDDPPVAVQTENERSAVKPMPDVPQPSRSPEPPVVDLSHRLTMQPPPIQPVGEKDMRVLLEAGVGLPGETGKNSWSDVMSSVQLDNAPRARFQPTPVYPFEAKHAGLTGHVQVEFIVDERGEVREPRIVNSSSRIFEEATLRAVAKWRFEPGRRQGAIVKFRMAVPVMFNLNEGS
jgi:protein TonB